jgi:1,2-diacylglycerol 3-beta-galactosyltransferase
MHPAAPAHRPAQGLVNDVPAILLVGGGEGMGKLEATVRELDARLQGSAQVTPVTPLRRWVMLVGRGVC